MSLDGTVPVVHRSICGIVGFHAKSEKSRPPRDACFFCGIKASTLSNHLRAEALEATILETRRILFPVMYSVPETKHTVFGAMVESCLVSKVVVISHPV